MTMPTQQPVKAIDPADDPLRVGRLIKIARYIEDHADEPLTLATLADIAGLSPSRLQRVFKAPLAFHPRPIRTQPGWAGSSTR